MANRTSATTPKTMPRVSSVLLPAPEKNASFSMHLKKKIKQKLDQNVNFSQLNTQYYEKIK